MHKVVILGAGQMGEAVLPLVNRAHYEVIGFGDNQGPYPRTIAGQPVFPVEQALELDPDVVLAAVMAQERCEALRQQAEACGYRGKFQTLTELYEAIDIRSASLIRLAPRLEAIPGNMAELGVYRGDTACLLNELFPAKKLYLFDTFSGFDERDLRKETGSTRLRQAEFADTSVSLVLSRMKAPEMVEVRAGWFPDTAEGLSETFALVSLDADLFAPCLAGLEWFMPRLSSGGFLFLHDYLNRRFPGVREAVEEYERRHGRLRLLPLGDLHGTAVIVG